MAPRKRYVKRAHHPTSVRGLSIIADRGRDYHVITSGPHRGHVLLHPNQLKGKKVEVRPFAGLRYHVSEKIE